MYVYYNILILIEVLAFVENKYPTDFPQLLFGGESFVDVFETCPEGIV